MVISLLRSSKMTVELITFNHLSCHSGPTAFRTRTVYWKPTRRDTDELPNKVWENYRGETLFVYFFSNLITISKSLGGFQHQVCYLIDFLKVVSLSDWLTLFSSSHVNEAFFGFSPHEMWIKCHTFWSFRMINKCLLGYQMASFIFIFSESISF